MENEIELWSKYYIEGNYTFLGNVDNLKFIPREGDHISFKERSLRVRDTSYIIRDDRIIIRIYALEK